MSLLHNIYAGLRGVFRRQEMDRDLDEEIRSHLELLTDEKIRNGMNSRDAAREAKVELGGIEQIKEQVRTVRAGVWFETVWQDIRFGVRMLRKNPGFTAVAVLTLALGIGANTAIFSVIYGVVLRPLPYPEPERIVQLSESFHGTTYERDVTYAELRFLRDRNSAFEFLGAFSPVGFNLAMGDAAERVNGLHVSSDYFHILGMNPVLGRDFLRDEDSGNGTHVAILSNGLWKRRTGGDPRVVGRTITLDGEPYSVIGVMPANFERIVTPLTHGETDVWTPLALVGRTVGSGQNLAVIGRLRAGLPLASARVQMHSVSDDFRAAFRGELNPTSYLDIEPYQLALSTDVRTVLLILFGAVGFVLLIACANVANLFLGRTAARGREIAVRTALGASRVRLFRQLITESVLLSLLGGLAGLILAGWGLHIILALSPTDLPRAADIHLDRWALLFALGVASLTGIGFGLAPALNCSRTDANEALKEGIGRATGGKRSGRFRSALAVSEIALSLVLLTGAGLLMETFWHVLRTDPGFNPSYVVSMQIWLTGSKYDSTPAVANFYNQVLQRIQNLPGVQSAAVVAAGLPLERGGNMPVRIPGKETPNSFEYRMVTSDYFRTLSVPLKLGRPFELGDNEQSSPVAIVNESVARTFFPNGDVLGQHVSVGSGVAREIVGIAGDVKSYLDQPAAPGVFIPVAQTPYGTLKIFESWFATNVIVRTSTDPLALGRSVEEQVHGLDSSVATGHIRSMEQVRSAAVAMRQFNMLLLSIFAGLAVVLAAIGIYGVLAFSVSQRTREIGVRMALGAQRDDVLKMMLGNGVRMVLLGIGIGIAGALALTRSLSSLLFGVRPTDPATFAGVAILLMLIALLACYIPARRATRVDPMVSLRHE